MHSHGSRYIERRHQINDWLPHVRHVRHMITTADAWVMSAGMCVEHILPTW